MEQDLKLTQDVRDEMERYLASVAEALRHTGTAENEVQSVLQDVRNHLMELLAARAPQAPSLRDVREVIAAMAPPESYAETPQPAVAAASPTKGRYPLSDSHKRLLMVFGFVLILAALAMTIAGTESLPVAVLAIVAGLIFMKWAIRGIPSRLAETPEPANASASPTLGRYPLSDSHKRLLMVFGFVLILAALALTLWSTESLPVAVLAVVAGLIFMKWAVRSGIPSRLAETPEPADAAGSPTPGRYPLSDTHKRLLMVFGFVLILAALAMTLWSTESLPVAVLAIVAGLIFVKWAVRQAPWSCLTALGSCLVVTVAAFAILVLLAVLCGLPLLSRFTWLAPTGIQGSGRVITETRTVGGFSRISASGISVVNVTQGEPQSLTVEADDNIVPLIETEVKGDTLRVGCKDAHWGGFSPSKPITINVTMKQISELEVSGSVRIHAGSIAANDLVIRESGATELAIAALTAQTLNVYITGAGKCDLAGKVDSQVVHGTGAIHYSADKLESLSAAVNISGAATVTVWAKEKLDVSASGASRVSYYGSPRVTQEASGVSHISSLGNH